MLSKLKSWLALAVVVLVSAACGGGGGSSGDSPFNTGGDSAVSNLLLTMSPSVISTATDSSSTLTAIAVNSNNQVVSGAKVVFTVSGGDLIADASETDSSGSITATVSVGSDTSPRSITVTATSNGVSRQAALRVINGSSSSVSTLSVSLSSAAVTSLNPATVTVSLKDAYGDGIANTVVTLSSVRSLGTLSATTVLTDSSGAGYATLYPASTATNGADEILATASVGGTEISGSAGFSVTPTAITISQLASDIGTGGSVLSAYGQANLAATLAGVTAGSPVNLSISSVCVRKGKAMITPSTQTVTTALANFTYVDKGCGASDSADTVTLSIDGTVTSSSIVVSLGSPTVSSLGFVSASPSVIYLKGSGFVENSTITFLVRDQNGSALPGRTVVMTPTTLAGGLTLEDGTSQVSKVSDSDGKVTVRVNSGTVPTPVRIKAVLSGTTISTVSSDLGIAVGLPSQLNFSLSQGTINIEGGEHDGTTNTYTIYAADRLANPVPADTSINFVAEGSQIEGVKKTALNANNIAVATANFVSQDPRPADHRVTVVAYALGEESFIDSNANNIYDSGEYFQDLGDIFLSRRFTNTYDSTVDQVITRALNSGATCVTPAGPADPSSTAGTLILQLDRTIPSVRGTTCDGIWSPNKEYVRRATETVLSNSSSLPYWISAGGGTLADGCVALSIPIDSELHEAGFAYIGGSEIYGLGLSGGMSVLIADSNLNRLNPMPAGTVNSVTASDGITVSVLGGTPVPNTSEATSFAFSYAFSDTTFSGSIGVSTKSPLGLVTTHTFYVSRASLPSGRTSCSIP